jgi:hypothetical protein
MSRKALRARFVGTPEHANPPLLTDAAGDNAWRDAAGRTTSTLTQLGIATKTSYSPFTTSSWDGAQTDSASPYEHTPVVHKTDGLGRLVRATHTLAGALLQESYAYDAAGPSRPRRTPRAMSLVTPTTGADVA